MRIKISNNFVSYNLEIKDKYTIVTGLSGVGKTTFIDLVRTRALSADAVDLESPLPILELIRHSDFALENHIIVLDEDNPILWDGKASANFKNSQNYFIIISRDRKIQNLKINLNSIMKMCNDNKGDHWLEPLYPSSEHLTKLGNTIIVEDSNSGYQFINKTIPVSTESSNGCSRLGSTMRKLNRENYTIVFDRAGIGYDYEDLLAYSKKHNIKIVSEIDWDSFESYILESPLYNITVDNYPDKETNATKILKQRLCPDYDKSVLPRSFKIPVYWKVKDALDLCNNRSSRCSTSEISFDINKLTSDH